MQLYKQTTRYTGAAAALMMVINHFHRDFPLTRENEFSIWQKTVNLPTKNCNLFALAKFAVKQGIPVKVVVEEPDYIFPDYRFKGYRKKEIELAAFMSDMFKEKAKKRGVAIEERDFDLNEVKDLIVKEKKVIILRIVLGFFRGEKSNRTVTHFVPVFGYEKGKFLMADPYNGFFNATDEELKEAFDAVKTKCKKDNRMLVFG